MARETKQERIVRSIFDQVSEHLYELKVLSSNLGAKELDIERWCQSVLKNCLGYTATNGYSITAQETRGRLRPDLVVSKENKALFVIEIKKIGYDLDKSDFRSGKIQLKEYLHQIGDVNWGILCNGYEWRLFDFTEQHSGGIETIRFDLRNSSDELDLSKKGVDEVCWNFLDLHESSYSSNAWSDYSKEATAFSPESLAKAILSVDVVKYIARAIRGEHEYKANTEVLIEKVQCLLENGLDNAVPGWNETKAAELNKYIKSQKRASRRRQKRGTKEVSNTTNIPSSGTQDAATSMLADKKPA